LIELVWWDSETCISNTAFAMLLVEGAMIFEELSWS